MLLLNREGSFHTESVPDGKLPAGNHRQFRCYCPLAPATASVQQESIPWQSFVFDAVGSLTIRNTSLGPFDPQAFLPVFFRGWAMAIFIFRPIREAVVSLYRSLKIWLCCAPVKTGVE